MMFMTKERPIRSTRPFTLPVHIAGIPAQVKVTTFIKEPPDHTTWASDLDYYGYTEIEYEVLDRKGYPAAWLERKITEDIDAEIRQAVEEEMSIEPEPDPY